MHSWCVEDGLGSDRGGQLRIVTELNTSVNAIAFLEPCKQELHVMWAKHSDWISIGSYCGHWRNILGLFTSVIKMRLVFRLYVDVILNYLNHITFTTSNCMCLQCPHWDLIAVSSSHHVLLSKKMKWNLTGGYTFSTHIIGICLFL